MTTLQIFDGSGRHLVAVGKLQCRAAEFAFDNPGWHASRLDRSTQRALLGLARRGIIEVSADNQMPGFGFNFRFKGAKNYG